MGNICQLNRLTALREIDIAITASHDLHLTLKVIINNVINQLKIDAADILMYKPGPQILEYAAGSGFHTQALQYTRLKIGESYAGRTARDQCMVSIPDLRKTDGFKRSKCMDDENFISYYGVPLIAKGNVIGVLEIFHRSSLDPDQEWLGFLEALSGQAAIAIENGVLITELLKPIWTSSRLMMQPLRVGQRHWICVTKKPKDTANALQS